MIEVDISHLLSIQWTIHGQAIIYDILEGLSARKSGKYAAWLHYGLLSYVPQFGWYVT